MNLRKCMAYGPEILYVFVRRVILYLYQISFRDRDIGGIGGGVGRVGDVAGQPPSKNPTYDRAAKSEALSSSEPEPKGISSALHSGCFIMYTLTSKGIYSGTDALFSFQFWRSRFWSWEISPWKPGNNAGDDREEGHWDLYGGYPQGIGGLPADWIYVRQTSRPFDRWQIKTIFMKDICHNKLYEYYCNGCWVSNDPNGGTWIKRTIP
ncbi:unnamed protein product [Owenia fusiformis]|uniref:Uncharacterized protein n=1 Tax=Owenia fusiformis TaxID=6347 RepID=A0A8J1USW9_OWEFU|nr:unnamed protein product [Owenia fusiformis]